MKFEYNTDISVPAKPLATIVVLGLVLSAIRHVVKA